MKAEGWYRDPFDAHELRWFSDGVPTDLVRDGDAESVEMPPTPTWDPPVPARTVGATDGSDLRRADEPLPDRLPSPVGTARLIAVLVLGVPVVFLALYLQLEFWYWGR